MRTRGALARAKSFPGPSFKNNYNYTPRVRMRKAGIVIIIIRARIQRSCHDWAQGGGSGNRTVGACSEGEHISRKFFLTSFFKHHVVLLHDIVYRPIIHLLL